MRPRDPLNPWLQANLENRRRFPPSGAGRLLKRVIAGHARLKAALANAASDVPTIRLAGLSDAARKALAIADNKIGDLSSFDIEILTETIAKLEAINFNVELTGVPI